MKRKLKRKLLFVAPVSLSLLTVPVFIFSCTSNQNKKIPINEEIERINRIDLKLKNNNILKMFEFEEIKDNSSNVLKYVSNLAPNNNFIYGIINFTLYENENKFDFIISVKENEIDSSIQTTKVFSINFQIKEENDIDKEVSNLSKNITLTNNSFNQSDLDSVVEDNFINYLKFSKNETIYSYKVISFIKDINNKQFKFKIEITNKQYPSLIRTTNEIILNFDISYNPGTVSKNIKEEIDRLNREAKPKFINNNLTMDELRLLNQDNLFSKLIGFNFDNANFQYKSDFLYKDINSGVNKIRFIVRVYKDNEPVDNNINFTNNFEVNFNLTYVKEEEPVNTTYFKNNADPYTGGLYDLAKPGGGTGKNSIILSNGPMRTAPSDGVPEYANSIKGKIFNDTEMNQLKNTFSLSFCDYSGGVSMGTGWILDYKLTDDGSYPITWYIATNSHVIQNLKIPNDTISPERYEVELSNFSNTERLIMRRIKTEILQFGQEVKHNDNNYWDRAYIPAANLKTILIGNDILTTSPSSFTNDGKWQNSEEYIDFAVMEVTFNTTDEAKTFTQDYVNNSNRHFKYHEKSILQDYSLKKENGYSIVGFPDAKTVNTPYFRPVNLYTNRAADNNNNPIVEDNKFSNLATSNYYNTFNNRKGMFDAALSLSFFGYDYRQAYQLRTWYNSWGLTYGIDYSNLGEGSSGSMLMDSDGYTVGIYFAADARASVGLAQALYCEGFSYQSKFGSYNLEGYDLIKGGFPNQKFSYKENLKKLYGANHKTKLFPNGV
ncbi:MAG: hypothetical protein HDR43_01115 [Mycoplasma sp.]|nr:hypothetical protein [Mycoplasma sp.]